MFCRTLFYRLPLETSLFFLFCICLPPLTLSTTKFCSRDCIYLFGMSSTALKCGRRHNSLAHSNMCPPYRHLLHSDYPHLCRSPKFSPGAHSSQNSVLGHILLKTQSWGTFSSKLSSWAHPPQNSVLRHIPFLLYTADILTIIFECGHTGQHGHLCLDDSQTHDSCRPDFTEVKHL